MWIISELSLDYPSCFNRVIPQKNPVIIRLRVAYPHIHSSYYYNYYKIIIYIFICGCPEVIHIKSGRLRKVDF